MATLVIVEAKLKADSGEKMQALMAEILPDTRKYDGCHSITYSTNLDDPLHVLLSEVWESRSHYERYFAWRQETGVIDRIVALLDGPPNIRYFGASNA